MMSNKLSWTVVLQLVRDGHIATIVNECIHKDRPNADCPGAPPAFALRLLTAFATRAGMEVLYDEASREQVDEVLSAIGEHPTTTTVFGL